MIGKISFIGGVLLSAVIFFSFQTEAEAEPWNIERSKHFIIHYQQAPAGYINQVIRKAEHYYQTITDFLGFKRLIFWTWGNRCKIYLYPSHEEYLRATGAPSWSSGHVQIKKKEISTYVWQELFFDTILPHEIAHIIFREFVGYDKKLPLWLDEGVACMQEYSSGERLRIAESLVKWGLHIDLDELSRIRDFELIIPFIFYNQSASIVDFLLRRFGRRKFVKFCRRLRDGEDWEQALKSVYRFKNLEELEKLWIADLTE